LPAGNAGYRYVKYQDSAGTVAYTNEPMRMFEHLS
jgi:hypothetical protein